MLVALLIGGAVALGILVFNGGDSARWDVPAFEADVRRAIPIGSSRQHVVQQLQASGLGSSYIDRERTPYAITPRRPVDLFALEDIQVIARFDGRDRLVDMTIKPGYTGP